MAEQRVQVIEAGIFTALQDMGRTSGQPYGVPPGGALDRAAHRAANQLVGNKATAATLEITLQGPSLLFENNALVSLTGTNFRAFVDGRAMPEWVSLFVRAGQLLEIKGGGGRLGYLAIHGGWDAQVIMGSRATYTRAKLSGYKGEGRALRVEDILTIATDYLEPLRQLPEGAGKFYPEKQKPKYGAEVTVRVVPGPHTENFSAEANQYFYNTPYKLSEQSDRMGYRFQGAALSYRRPDLAEIAACGTIFGTIQVPPDGQPIILMADHQLTGGYPIIGVVLSDDLPLVAQLLPGQKLRFVENSPSSKNA